MVDFTFQQVRQRGQTDVWVRPHVKGVAVRKCCGAHLVEKDERAYHPALRRGESAADAEAVAQIFYRRNDNKVYTFGIGGSDGHGAAPCRRGVSMHLIYNFSLW
jgi:hypothetical protein